MNIGNLEIQTCDIIAWEMLERNFSNSSYLQSWQYGNAKERTGKWKAERYCIIENGLPVGLVQILVRKLPVLVGLARINRGPLLLIKDDSDRYKYLFQSTLQLINQLCVKNNWIVLQIAPEILFESSWAYKTMQTLNFRKLKTETWSSGVLDLTQAEEKILKSFDGKWRNSMLKGFKSNLEVVSLEKSIKNLNKLLVAYKDLQQTQKFEGLSPQFILEIANNSSLNYSFNLFEAIGKDEQLNNITHGFLASITYCDTTTYLIGAANAHGRKLSANSFLLWHAILDAKLKGSIYFDIGGLSESTPQGVKAFKKGLKAKPYKLIGEWRKWFCFEILKDMF